MTSLLDLPPDVRARIYAHAGLVRRGCTIDLCVWTSRNLTEPNDNMSRCWRRTSSHNPNWRLCLCDSLPVALLRVCRLVHAEAVAVLYGSNRFAVRAWGRRGQPPAEQLASVLVQMPAYGLARMASLLVRLNCWPCPLGHETDLDKYGACLICNLDSAVADPPLMATDEAGARMLAAWDRLCARLAEALRQAPVPAQLDLALVCDVEDEETAHRVVQPMKQLPQLKSCTVRLGRKRDRHLTQVARDAAQELTRDTNDASATAGTSFRFRNLPTELRTRVLEFTHLGCAALAGYHPQLETIEIRNSRLTRTDFGFFDEGCCLKCTTTYMDCCCPQSHASFAPHCVCRRPPTELFLVDRQMYREAALDVFYPRNRFEFRNDSFAETLEVLEKMTPAALKRIRRVWFTVTDEQFALWRPAEEAPPVAPDAVSAPARRPPAGDPGWRPLVAFVAAHMDLPRLSITVDAIDCVWKEIEHRLIDDAFDPSDDLRHLYDMCMDLATALCSLKDLGHVEFGLGAFDDIAPWLEREVLGSSRFKGVVEVEEEAMGRVPRRDVRLDQRIPRYHDINKRLEGSNYHPGKPRE